MNKKILVTGAAGFIGYHLVKYLASNGYDVIGIDNINDYYPTSLKYDRLSDLGFDKSVIRYNIFVESIIYPKCKFIRMDIQDAGGIMLLFQKEQFDTVIHLAAQAGVRYSIENPKSYVDSNIVGFMNILEGCRQIKIEHLIYASSSSIYGLNAKQPFSIKEQVDKPISLYAATKKSNELMAHVYSHLYNISTTGLRFFTVYGAWGRPDMAPFIFADSINNNKPMQIFNHGEMMRDFTYIGDIVNGLGKILEKGPIEKYNIYNLGNNKPINLLYFVECLEKAFGKKAEKKMLDMQPGDVVSTWADVSDLIKDYDYSPNTPIEAGTAEFVKWYQDYYKNKWQVE